jgi:signal transduction histidine kinase
VPSRWSRGTKSAGDDDRSAPRAGFLTYAAGMTSHDWRAAPARERPEPLPSAPGPVRRAIARHPRLVDALVALVTLALLYIRQNGLGLSVPLGEQLHGPLFAITFVAAAVLLVRRSFPITTLAVVLAACAAEVVLDRDVSFIALAIALYSVGVYRSGRAALVAGALSAAVLIPLLIPSYDASDDFAFQSGLNDVVGYVGIGTLLGVNVGNVQRLIRALHRQAEQGAIIAVTNERDRITREMHDVIAHGLSVMVQLADGAEATAEADPSRSRQAVHQIGVTGPRCLADVRRILGMLLDPDAPPSLAPQPTVHEIDALIDTYRAAGLPVEFTQRGEPSSDPALQLLIYRAVQESLTNALRYSVRPIRVSVAVRSDERGTQVEISDDGLRVSGQQTVGSGRGLLGLRERAALYGGTVDAGPNEGHGWRTTVHIPPQEDQNQ